MINCIILGAGRSGTSMLSGILYNAGYYMGDKLYNPNPSNPKGFFETKKINSINEDILSAYDSNISVKFLNPFNKKYTVKIPGKNQRWLSLISVDKEIKTDNRDIIDRINEMLSIEPYCYKDPRFSYTLPIWKKYFKSDTIFICIFREPEVTVKSILKECADREYLSSLYINKGIATKVWVNIYSHILKNYNNNPI